MRYRHLNDRNLSRPIRILYMDNRNISRPMGVVGISLRNLPHFLPHFGKIGLTCLKVRRVSIIPGAHLVRSMGDPRAHTDLGAEFNPSIFKFPLFENNRAIVLTLVSFFLFATTIFVIFGRNPMSVPNFILIRAFWNFYCSKQ